MEQYYVGIHPYGHDSSIAIIDLGRQDIYAYNLERFTRFKHDYRFCDLLIRDAVQNFEFTQIAVASNEVSVEIIQHFNNVYHYESILKHLKRYKNAKWKLLFHPKSVINYYQLKSKVSTFRFIQDKSGFADFLKNMYSIKNVKFYDHHHSHALAAFYLCNWIPSDEDGIITLDGQGDGFCNKVYAISDGLKELMSTSNDFSFNMLYTRATAVLGFTPNADEGKLEALACYSSMPRKNTLYTDLLKVFSVDEDGKLNMDWSVIGYNISSVPNSLSRIEEFLRGYLIRMSKEDFAGAVQSAYEDLILNYVTAIQGRYRFKRMLFSGGGFANVKLNMKLFESGLFEKVYVCPAMGDDGIAIGCALSNAAENGADINWVRKISIPYFGQAFSSSEVIEVLLKNSDVVGFEELDADSFVNDVANSIYQGKIVALFQGRMEYGPRALGNRSILASPLVASIRDDINMKFKRREYFQPFCPTFLEKDRNFYFSKSYGNKHMTSAFTIKEEYKSVLPSVVHVDGTCRAQFLEEDDNPNYYRIIEKFKELSGHGVLLDTSFNIHGKTIVRTPQDAVDDYLNCGLDFLYFEGIKVYRK